MKKAKIYIPAKTSMQSGRGKQKKWLLEFSRDIKSLIKKKKTNCNCIFWGYCFRLRIPPNT